MKVLIFIGSILFALLLLYGCNNRDDEDVINLPDDELNWSVEFIGKPMNDAALNSISIHPDDDSLWFVTSWRGIYITRNAGKSWENYFSDFTPALEINPVDPSNVLIGSWKDLYHSEDYGKTWTRLKKFDKVIQSLLIRKIDQSFLVGLRWEDSPMANGIYKSIDGGKTWNHYSYGLATKGLIPWDIEEDPVNNRIYIATEIYNHPEPYDPPFLRSSDGGEHWQDINGELHWHALKIQVHPETNNVYVLTEGAGLFCSPDFGETWEYVSNYFWLDFIINQDQPERFFGGNHTANASSGGVYFSKDSGKSFEHIGLQEEVVNGLCMDGHGKALYATAYGSGIYRITSN
jgi:hypothetical protein